MLLEAAGVHIRPSTNATGWKYMGRWEVLITYTAGSKTREKRDGGEPVDFLGESIQACYDNKRASEHLENGSGRTYPLITHELPAAFLLGRKLPGHLSLLSRAQNLSLGLVSLQMGPARPRPCIFPKDIWLLCRLWRNAPNSDTTTAAGYYRVDQFNNRLSDG